MKNQNNKIDDKNLMKDIRLVKLTKKIEDKEIVELQNLKRQIEKKLMIYNQTIQKMKKQIK